MLHRHTRGGSAPDESAAQPLTQETHHDTDHTRTWPDLAIGLYDRLTGRNAEITYDFSDMHVKVPSGTGAKAEHAEWVLSGSLKISTRDTSNRPN